MPSEFEDKIDRNYLPYKMEGRIVFERDAISLTFEQLSYEDKLRAVKEGWAYVLGDKPDRPDNMRGILFRPKQRQIFYSKVKYPAYIGAFRSGKSLILCIKALHIALKYPGTRVALIRETYPQLTMTTISTLVKLFNYFGWRPKTHYNWIETKKKFVLNTQPLKSEIIYLAARAEGETLEDAIANFQSFEADWIGVDEAPGIDERLYLVLQGRTGQWGTVTEESDKQLVLTGNPPSMDHYLYKRYVQHTLADGTPLINPEDYFLTIASTYENRANISPDYIRQLEAFPPFWRKTFLLGEWGFIPPDGEPVFSNFRMDLYAAKEELKYHPDRPIIRGWDIGPSGKWKACVICQMDPKGVLLVLHEILNNDPGIENFGRLVQNECRMRFPKCTEYRDFTDPVAFDYSQTDMRSPAMILAGIGIRLAPGEKEFQMRNEAVVQLMSRIIDGSPGIFIDPVHCVKLLQGFAGGYRYSIIDSGNNRISKSVVKDIFSHPQDALAYACSRLITVDKKQKDEWLSKIRARMGGYNQKKAAGGYR